MPRQTPDAPATDWFDENAPPPPSGVDQITAAYHSALGRAPTTGEAERWLSMGGQSANGWNNPDYVQQRIGDLQQTTEAKNFAARGGASRGGASQSGASGDPAAFIANWQRTHAPSEGKAPLIAALKQAGFNAAPYMYGSTESGNEISLNGQRYKVFSGDEGTPGSSWFVPGSEGEGDGGQQGAPFKPPPAWGETFQGPQWNEKFQAPDQAALLEDPAYKERLARGQQALERSAAAKGTLLTGGTLKDLSDYTSGTASQEYASAYGRKLGEYQQKYGEYQGQYGRAADEYNQRYKQYLDAYGQGLNTFNTNYGVARNAQNDTFNQQYSLAQLGLAGAQGATGAGQYYGGQGSDLITGGANAGAAGQVGSANAWNNAYGNMANTAVSLYGLSQYGNPRLPRQVYRPGMDY